MQNPNRKSQQYGLKDKEVPPVKGAVTDLQDLVQKPAGIFSTPHPAEQVSMANGEIFDLF